MFISNRFKCNKKALADDDECLCFSMKMFCCCFCVGKVNLFANNG